VRLLERPVRRPDVPDAPPNLVINRDAFNVFGVLGLGNHRMRIPQAIELIEGCNLEIGYCCGRDVNGYGLTDFPYDYERLFQNRVLIIGNSQAKEFRAIGASILLPWLKDGGGLVITGGENAFDFELEQHEINRYFPIVPKRQNLRKQPQQLQPPDVAEHPIFEGVSFADPPWLLYVHDVEIKPDADTRVLMRAGGYPFIVEQRTGDQITMAVACNHFGTEEELGGRRHLRNWDQWPKLFANIVEYAGGKR